MLLLTVPWQQSKLWTILHGQALSLVLSSMLIGELSRKTGLSKDTIRFYEKIGLIVASDRQARTRLYKEYSPETLERLTLISQGKKLGFTLSEIGQLIDAWESGTLSQQDKVSLVEGKIAQIVEKMRQLDQIKTYLTHKLSLLNKEV